jgi:hypothetical protein
MRVATVESVVDADALTADVLLVGDGATLTLGAPSVWGALTWRIGARETFALHVADVNTLTADELIARGIADGPADADWARGRSDVALDAAASLIRMRGGDTLERAEFARLFAAGIPQEGLRAFLEKRRARFA